MIGQRLINDNGRLVPHDTRLFTAYHRPVRYGDGLFESMRAFDGRLPFVMQHFDRLERGATALSLILPPALRTAGLFLQELEKLLAANQFRNARIRLMLYRQGEGFYGPEKNEAGYVITAEEAIENHYPLNDEGLQVGTYTANYKSCTSFSAFKTNNALLYVLAALHKKEKQLDECLLINQKGLICESISANVFLLKENLLITPAQNQGCIMGIMRQVVLQLAPAAGLQPLETGVSLEDVLEASELFITNAASGIQWVSTFQQKQYEKESTTLIHAELNKRIG